MVENNDNNPDGTNPADAGAGDKPKRRRSFRPRASVLGRGRAAAAAAQPEERPVAGESPAVEQLTDEAPAEAVTEAVAPIQPEASVDGATDAKTDAPDEVEADTADETVAAESQPAESQPPAAEAAEAEPAAAEQPVEPAAPSAPSLFPLFQAPPVLAPAPGDDDDDDDDDALGQRSGTTTRRRSRRRTGEGEGEAQPQQQQRQPRERVERVAVQITEPQKIKGSTRLEAKKQRRRDGRDAGRRRTVVTEAEFLARRESVDRVMVVRSTDSRIEIGVLEDGVLAEHYVAKAQNASLIGNVYLGRVQNVLPSMEAAFVDIGRGRNAVLYSGEVDWDAAAVEGEKNQPRRIELALKPGDRVLVQVTKDPVGHKGARLTSQISLPGRYLVYVPGGSMNGISRKLPDTERARLKRILKEVLPDGVGVIVRTAAEGATEEQLTLDVNRLTAQWQHISEQVEKANAPALLHSEPDLLVKIIRDVFNEDFARLVIAGNDAQQTIASYLGSVAPDLLDRVETWQGGGDVFAGFRVQEQIDKALDRKVWLPSGGSLVIDRTEAMTVIDVNTGKFVGSGGNLEETVTKNNLEAAEEIVRQLRLRDVGGIIVIDFIDMVLENNRDLVLRRLVECLSRDRTKHQVAEVTSLGLVQMTRKKLGLGLAESMTDAPRQPLDSKPEPRRGRKQQSQSAPQRPAQGSTHAITDDAKNALALIAKSTIHRDAVAEEAHNEPAEVAVAAAAAIVVELPAEADEPSSAPVFEPVIDLPVVAAAPSRTIAPDAETLLSTVLDALPEPKKPGQGRSRSRRVSTGALTAGDASRVTSDPTS
ncbi:Rne/Rng family ribonuclease [Amnibacterium flavum]|uniref:Ribonuclease E n=1 Tax=Amnibacterium flavum TaxID=2173173 RepID=A0A2V1HN28_9MICO|nr:Rne/Rng family ribonuclease [Amnibacterium flavum]PVZ94033.1 ribonuclease E/G [Amnibacterium flavum]